MAKNHWTLLLGLIIITGILVTAAFSLGLYVGKRGLIEQGIQQGINQPRQTVNNQQPAQNLPDQNAAQAHDNQSAQIRQEQPDLTGRFVNFSDNLLVLNTPNGMRQVILSEDTLLISPEKGELSWEDISRGDTLAIFGSLNENTRQLEAVRIILLPVNQQSLPYTDDKSENTKK